MISFTPPLTVHTSKRRKHVGKSKCDFLLQTQTEGCHPQYSVLMQLSILSQSSGIRLEFLELPLALRPHVNRMIDLLLTPPLFSSPIPLFFNKIKLTVKKWNCDYCWIEHCEKEIKLYLSDEDEAAQIKVSFYPPHMQPMFIPHEQTSVRVQNMCGSCVTPYQLNLSCFQHISKTKVLKRSFSACESLSTVTGNFVLCSNRSKVDFRGVRSVASMASDWKIISGLRIEDVSTTIYMIVLKGCLGKALFFDTSCCCYLANQTAEWCTGILHFGDVCDVIELRDIRWNKMPSKTSQVISQSTLQAKSSIHISRRGGTVIRFVFSPPITWSDGLEKEVISDCDLLTSTLGDILKGKTKKSLTLVPIASSI